MESRLVALIGKSYELASHELATVLSRYNSTHSEFNPPYLLEIHGDIDPNQLVVEAGGIVKIYKIIDHTAADLETTIAQDIIASGKDHFCLSSYKTDVELKYLAQSVKKILHQHDIKPHFRLLDGPFTSSGIINKYIEYLIVKHEGENHILSAVAVQNLNYWSQKDYGRPAFDPASGMLPPKVARMMINSSLPIPLTPKTKVYDPMCGSGTLLHEGLDLNLAVIGSDFSQKAVSASTQNSAWFVEKYRPSGQVKVFLADATHVKLADVDGQVDSIVFEGYLGPPSPRYTAVPNLIKGLEKLYKGVFKNLYPLLKNKGYLVCALPEYDTKNGVKNLDTLVDWTATLGYTRCARFTYGRPQAFVKRAIYILQKIDQ